MSSVQVGADCANCGTPLAGPYCAACGQEARPQNPSVRYFLRDFARELFDYDGKVFRSVWLLFARPGFLTREAFADRRASYLSPLRLYLLFSVLFFAALAFTPNMLNLTWTPSSNQTADAATVAQRTAEMREAVNNATNVWVPRLMFVFMPIFAALVMLVRPSRNTYPQHLYFAMHVHAVGFFAAALVALAGMLGIRSVSGATGLTMMVFVLVHFVLAFRRTYDTTAWGAAWRTAVLGSIYLTILIAGVAASWLSVIAPISNRPL